MPKNEGVSRSVVRRLPRYYRFLGDLLKKDVTRISSRELAQLMQLTASQIRQDLNCFGGFGQQGYGYNVAALHKEIANIMGLNKLNGTILLGAGNLGRTIAKHMHFESSGCRLEGIFDVNPQIIGQALNGLVVQDVAGLSAFCEAHRPRAAILCIPKEVAYDCAKELMALGVNCFWNFSHYDLTLNFEGAVVENVHLGDSLMTLCYQINAYYADEEASGLSGKAK